MALLAREASHSGSGRSQRAVEDRAIEAQKLLARVSDLIHQYSKSDARLTSLR
jgi:hypothetical protein